MDEKRHNMNTYRESVLVSTMLNFSGSFMDACRLITIPLPSKSKTATPKNNGIAWGLKYLKFSER